MPDTGLFVLNPPLDVVWYWEAALASAEEYCWFAYTSTGALTTNSTKNAIALHPTTVR